METVELKKENVFAAYNAADSTGKGLLQLLLPDLFPVKTKRDPFSITTIEQAYAATGRDINDVPYPEPKNERQKCLNAIDRCWTVVDALNEEDWYPDYSDTDQYKWRVWVEWDDDSSAFVFDDSGYVGSDADAGCCPRFALKTQGLANHFATHFLGLINDATQKRK